MVKGIGTSIHIEQPAFSCGFPEVSCHSLHNFQIGSRIRLADDPLSHLRSFARTLRRQVLRHRPCREQGVWLRVDSGRDLRRSATIRSESLLPHGSLPSRSLMHSAPLLKDRGVSALGGCRQLPREIEQPWQSPQDYLEQAQEIAAERWSRDPWAILPCRSTRRRIPRCSPDTALRKREAGEGTARRCAVTATSSLLRSIYSSHEHNFYQDPEGVVRRAREVEYRIHELVP